MKKIITMGLISSALVANTVKLDNVIVSATKVVQNIEDTTSSAQVITQEEIQERGYVSVVEALNALSGVGFTQDGGLGGLTKLYVRGVGGARVLVLVDGIRFQDPSSKYGADFSRLILSDIERIELISGAQSGIWGSDASAGVINIITKKAANGFHSGIKLSYGSFNTSEVGFFTSYAEEKYNAKFSLTNYQTDGYSAQSPYGSDLDDYEDDYYKNRTINLSLGYKISKDDSISTQFTNIAVKNNNDTYTISQDSANKDMDVTNETNLFNVTYKKTISNHTLSLKYNFAKFDKDEKDATSGIKLYEGKTHEFELDDSISYRKKDFVLVGASYKKDDVETTLVDTTEDTHKENSNAIFATNTNYINKLILTQSLRRDDYSNFGVEVTGKVGVKYNFTKESYLSSNYGTGYNAPSIIMILNPNGVSNENLEAENTKSFDVTASYKGASLTYFYNTVDNLISYDKTAKKHINIDGTSTFKGFEVKYTKTIIEDIFINLSYTRLSAKDKNGIDLRRRVKDTYKFSTDYYFNDDLVINLNGEYIGERYDNMYSVTNPSQTRGRQTGKYLVMNFVTNYDINKNFTTFFKVNNLTDKYYQVVDGYSTSPRAFYAGCNIKF